VFNGENGNSGEVSGDKKGTVGREFQERASDKVKEERLTVVKRPLSRGGEIAHGRTRNMSRFGVEN